MSTHSGDKPHAPVSPHSCPLSSQVQRRRQRPALTPSANPARPTALAPPDKGVTSHSRHCTQDSACPHRHMGTHTHNIYTGTWARTWHTQAYPHRHVGTHMAHTGIHTQASVQAHGTPLPVDRPPPPHHLSAGCALVCISFPSTRQVPPPFLRFNVVFFSHILFFISVEILPLVPVF